MKSFRYGHEQNCKGGLENKPVKKHTNPRPKQQPKPKPPPDRAVGYMSWGNKAPPEIYYSDDDEEEEQQTTHKPLSKPVRNQVLKPQYINPQTALSQHYQLIQQQMMKHKQEKMNTLCQNMFSSKTKKR